MADTRRAVDAVLRRWADRVQRERGDVVGETMAYSLTSPGKRMRPALVLATYRELGGVGDCDELATSVEVVHTYSLVHDDLPCMDNDEFRRGQPTAHRRFGVGEATEAAFRLVPLAARVLAAGSARMGLAYQTQSSLGRELFEAAGAAGMIRGQVLDLEAEGRRVSEDELVDIHMAKTGALIRASCVMGALAAGADSAVLDVVRSYGRHVGLAFQIVDDILDATSTTSELGKTAGKDARQQKATYVNIVGLAEASRQADEHVARAMDYLAAAGLDSGLLSKLARFISDRRS